ncbi:MAG: AAA family ATPase [Candidatus Micrarchaeota archaeon]|nr:AAA family ATPase [Candidatus Micrarchaeota archaeon]
MPNRVVIVAGSPGAGKTTLIKGLASNPNVKIANMGTLMLEIAKRDGLADDRDKMRLLSNDRISALRDRAFAEVAAMKGHIVVDTHATVEANGRYVPGIPVEQVGRIKALRALVYIDSLTDDILERRKLDRSRDRESEDKIRIDDQRQINMSILSVISSSLNIPLYIIFNRQGRLEEGIAALKANVEEIFSEK